MSFVTRIVGVYRILGLNLARQVDEAVIHAAAVIRRSPAVPRWKNDLEATSIRKRNAIAQAAEFPETIQESGHGSRMGSAVARFPLEFVDLLQDLDWDDDRIVLEIEKRIWIVDEDICVAEV